MPGTEGKSETPEDLWRKFSKEMPHPDGGEINVLRFPDFLKIITDERRRCAEAEKEAARYWHRYRWLRSCASVSRAGSARGSGYVNFSEAYIPFPDDKPVTRATLDAAIDAAIDAEAIEEWFEDRGIPRYQHCEIRDLALKALAPPAAGGEELAEALHGGFVRLTDGEYFCVHCEAPIYIVEWQTAVHRPGCIINKAKAILQSPPAPGERKVADCWSEGQSHDFVGDHCIKCKAATPVPQAQGEIATVRHWDEEKGAYVFASVADILRAPQPAAPLASAVGGMPEEPGYRHEISGHETVPRESYDTIRAHALTLQSTNERLAGEVERLNRQRDERADYVERELSRLRREPESAVRAAVIEECVKVCDEQAKTMQKYAADSDTAEFEAAYRNREIQARTDAMVIRALQPASGDEVKS